MNFRRTTTAASTERAWPTSQAPSADRSSVPESCPRTDSFFEKRLIDELPVLYRVATRLTANATAAEDLVGQTILLALSKQNQFDGYFLRSWLIQILNHLFFRERSRTANRPTSQLDESLTTENSWSKIDQQVISRQVLQELDRMPEDQRMVIVLCDVEELSYEEVAQALDLPIGTVRSRLFRGRRVLRERTSHLMDPSDLQLQ